MSIGHRYWSWPAIVAVLLLVAPVEHPACQEVATLTLQAAVERALERNPLLAVSRAEIAAAEARIDQAAFGPQPELGLALENFAGSGEVSGTDALETTLQLSRAFELGGKQKRRVDAAQAARDVAFAGLDVARLDVASDVARRFVELLGVQEELRCARRFLELAGAIREQAERRVAAGSALSAELYRARAQVGREQLFLLSAQAKLDVAWRALAATWGEPGATPAVAAGDLFAAPPLEPLPAFLARLEQSPRFAGLAAGERLREAERSLAEARARPDIALSFGVRHLNEPDDAGLVAGISVPIGSRARSRALAAEAAALLEQTRAERAADLAGAVAAVGGLHREAVVRRESLEVLQRDILPAAAAALEQIERGYGLGRLSYGEYSVAARELLDAELARVRIATEYHQLLTEIESLTGVAVLAGERN